MAITHYLLILQTKRISNINIAINNKVYETFDYDVCALCIGNEHHNGTAITATTATTSGHSIRY